MEKLSFPKEVKVRDLITFKEGAKILEATYHNLYRLKYEFPFVKMGAEMILHKPTLKAWAKERKFGGKYKK